MPINLVVGGSKGIGLEVLKQMVELGPTVNMSRTIPNVQSNNLTNYQVDILNTGYPEFEGLNTITYCPGSINLKPFLSLKEEDYKNEFDINFFGLVRLISNYSKLLKKSKSTSIVLFSTVAVGTGMPYHTSIAAAKGALEAYGRSLAAELAPKVRVNIIAPSVTDTDLAAHLLRNDKMRESTEERHPLKRILTSKEISDIVMMLHNSPGITGQVIHADNGMSSLRV